MRWWLRQARRHDSTWQGPPWESVPCVVGHGRIIRPRVRTSVGPGRPSERRGRVAGRELAARPAVDPGGGRAAVPYVPVPEVSQTWRSSSTASRPGSLQIPGASVLALTPRSLTNEAKRPCHRCPRQPSRKSIHRVYRAMCLADGAMQALSGLRDNDQVNMIGHQAICPDRDLLCAAELRHELEVVLVVFLTEECLLSGVSLAA